MLPTFTSPAPACSLETKIGTDTVFGFSNLILERTSALFSSTIVKASLAGIIAFLVLLSVYVAMVLLYGSKFAFIDFL